MMLLLLLAPAFGAGRIDAWSPPVPTTPTSCTGRALARDLKATNTADKSSHHVDPVSCTFNDLFVEMLPVQPLTKREQRRHRRSLRRQRRHVPLLPLEQRQRPRHR